jgi:transposase-like protein
MATFTPFNHDIATMHLCRNCLAKGVTRSVATVPGRPVVILTLVCQSCGHHWTVERESRTSREQTLDIPESS